jgi:transcriptional regulator with XRE-family HTH domain
MIKNDKQYQYSQECARSFQNSIDALDRDEKMKAEEPNNWQMNRDVKQSHLTALQAEIAEYQKLINCDRSQPLEITVENFNQLPEALIKARIAAKMSQKELAEILGIEEQKIQEYEETDYQCASFAELLEASAVLAIEFKMAVMQVDFAEIAVNQQIAEKWRKERMPKSSREILNFSNF